MKKIILGILSILTLSYAEGTTQKMDNTYIIYIRQSYLSIPRLEMSETIDSVSYDFGDVKSILPYIGSVNYDSSSESSIKEASMVAGIYTSIGNASYLLELSYGYITTKYKEPTIDDLHQSDISLIYNRYYPNYMFRLGIHHIATNDTDLGATNVFIGAIGAYVFNGKDKYSYGLEGYYINYKDGHDDQGIKKNISIIQATPYFSYFKYINKYHKNNFNVRMNYILANEYLKKNYLSIELSDTYFYKEYFSTIKVYLGEMKTGIKDSGLSVYNTKDLMKSGYSIKLGYYFNNNFILSGSYALDTLREYKKTKDAKNSSSLLSLSYTY